MADFDDRRDLSDELSETTSDIKQGVEDAYRVGSRIKDLNDKTSNKTNAVGMQAEKSQSDLLLDSSGGNASSIERAQTAASEKGADAAAKSANAAINGTASANAAGGAAVSAGSSAAGAAGSAGAAGAEMAAGSAAGPIGIGLAVAWQFKDEIFKVVVAICTMIALVFIILITALPTVALNKVFGLDGKKPANDASIEAEYTELLNDIQSVVEKGHDEAVKKVYSDIVNHRGLNVSLSSVQSLANSNDFSLEIKGGNSATSPVYHIVISDSTKYTGVECDAAFVMSAYSVSMQNKPYVIEGDENAIPEDTIFDGTNKKDLIKKLNKQTGNMFPVSGPVITTVQEDVEIQDYREEMVPVTYTETVAEPTEYWVYTPVEVLEYINPTRAYKSTYYVRERAVTTQKIVQPNYRSVSVKCAIIRDRHIEYYLKTYYEPVGGTHIIDPHVTYTKTRYEKQMVPYTRIEKRDVTTYKYTIQPFNEECIYTAYDINKYALYCDTDTQIWQVIESMEKNLCDTVGVESMVYHSKSLSSSIVNNITSVNGVTWYVTDIATRELEKLFGDDMPAEYRDNFINRTQVTISADAVKTNFITTALPYADDIVSAYVNNKGYIVIKYTETAEDGTQTVHSQKWFSSEYYSMQSDSFINPFKYNDSYISSHYSYRPGLASLTGDAYHRGTDLCRWSGSYGQNVKATASGKVVLSGPNGGYGNCVIIDHGNNIYSLYGHLSQCLCAVGDQVIQGQVIAKSGNTGNVTGAHLHFEIRIGANDRAHTVDAETYVDLS